MGILKVGNWDVELTLRGSIVPSIKLGRTPILSAKRFGEFMVTDVEYKVTRIEVSLLKGRLVLQERSSKDVP